MYLIVVDEATNRPASERIFREARDSSRYLGVASMGAFCVARNLNHATALATDSAETCLIIAVHCSQGVGALGHYHGSETLPKILNAVQSMVQACGGVPRFIVFAAGAAIAEKDRGELLEQTRREHRHATVLYQSRSREVDWGSGVYLPLTGQLAFFESLPGRLSNFVQASDAGISTHPYD